MSRKLIAALVMALVPTAPAFAANLLVNGSFEATPLLPFHTDQYAPGGHIQHYPDPAETSQYVPGWTLGDPSVSDLYRAPVVYNLVPAAAADGLQFLSLNWSPLGGVTLFNTVSQAFVLGEGATGVSLSLAMAIESGFTGSTLQAQILNSQNQIVAQSGLFTHQDGNGTWSRKSWTADVGPGTYTLRLAGTGNGNAWDVLIDDVNLEQIGRPGATAGAVPEPATWAMMIVGFLGAGSALRRRRSGLAS